MGPKSEVPCRLPYVRFELRRDGRGCELVGTLHQPGLASRGLILMNDRTLSGLIDRFACEADGLRSSCGIGVMRFDGEARFLDECLHGGLGSDIPQDLITSFLTDLILGTESPPLNMQVYPIFACSARVRERVREIL